MAIVTHGVPADAGLGGGGAARGGGALRAGAAPRGRHLQLRRRVHAHAAHRLACAGAQASRQAVPW